jgi:hypothetical protein
MTDTPVCRIAATLDAAEVKQINKIVALVVTDVRRILGRHSRAGRFRGPPPDSRLEKHARANQQDSSRNSLSRSGLFGSRRHG